MWASSRAAAAFGHVNPFWVFVLVLGFPLPMYLLGGKRSGVGTARGELRLC